MIIILFLVHPETAEAVEDVFFVPICAIAEDPEGLEVTYEFLNYPDWLTADADSIYGTPLEGAGDFSFSVTANDGYLTSEITVSVDFESVPDTPTHLISLSKSWIGDSNFECGFSMGGGY